MLGGLGPGRLLRATGEAGGTEGDIPPPPSSAPLTCRLGFLRLDAGGGRVGGRLPQRQAQDVGAGERVEALGAPRGGVFGGAQKPRKGVGRAEGRSGGGGLLRGSGAATPPTRPQPVLPQLALMCPRG